MKIFKKVFGAALVAAMVLGLAACGGGNDKPAGSGSAAPSGGNVIKVMLGTNVMSLDTNLATDGDSFEVIADCIDGLTQMDAEGAAIPAIAESWEPNEDGTQYTFHLREDANWANGTPVTANDFVFAWQRGVLGNEEYGYMFSDIAQIKNAQAIMDGTADVTSLGVTAKDDKTLVVDLEVPVSYFESLMYFPTFYPINQEFYEGLEEGTYGTSADTFLSNGAFVLSDYLPGTASLSLTKNENYYDAANVTLSGIEYQVVGSSDNALTAFKNGSLDLVTVGGDQVSAAEADAATKDNMKVTGAGYMWYLTFSQTTTNANGYLANANLRLAFTNAIDREALVDNYVKDGSLATYTCVPPQFAASSTTGEDFSADQTRFADVCSFDVKKAQDYLEKAKQELGVDSFKFTIIYGNNEGDEVTKVAQAIQQQIQDTLPGVTIELSNMTKAERLDKMQNDNYEIALTRWGPDYADPMTYLGMWITNNANNYGFWSNAEYDQLIADCTTGQYITDYDARWAALYDAETIVMNEAVIAPLYTKANANIIASNVSGVEFHPVALNRVYKRCVVQ
ncbi:MAG: peptide ABC transporter substrate-binding protein [Lachnospiraceae bacterium]|nr:peptide ABC transporter substrate-binding protein [Lachnospiraceae bacterium]